MQTSPTDLTDSQWTKIEKLFNKRKRKHPMVATATDWMDFRNCVQSNGSRRLLGNPSEVGSGKNFWMVQY